MKKILEKQNIIYIILMSLSLIMSAVDIIRYFVLVGGITSWIILFINVLLGAILLAGLENNLEELSLINTVAYILLAFNTNYGTVEYFNITYFIQFPVCGIMFIFALICRIVKKNKINTHHFIAAIISLAMIIGGTLTCVINVNTDNNKTSYEKEIWAVSDIYDKKECSTPGTLVEEEYSTKAYGTDSRDVKKKALVYLPYGYDDSESYDILYLMHGTGDDQNYWLKKNADNKVMVDNLIASKVIKPFIIVTPTFYTENDCADDLDELTYAFAKELRNDLMPYIEGKYSTYAKDTTPQGFTDSRDHRLFAGLSRGAVTTMHSALLNSLDYISYFGVFSGSRTDINEYQTAMKNNNFENYKINYLYASAGSFDFPLYYQQADYNSWVNNDSRLNENNTNFDVFPLCKHSASCWHLALYNFLGQVLKV